MLVFRMLLPMFLKRKVAVGFCKINSINLRPISVPLLRSYVKVKRESGLSPEQFPLL